MTRPGWGAPPLRYIASGTIASSAAWHAAIAGELAAAGVDPAVDPAVVSLVSAAGAPFVVQDAAAWSAVLLGEDAPRRVRLIGGSRQAFAAASSGRADIALYDQPVLEAGRVEMLTFLHEQSVAVTAHRFGSPTPLAEGLFNRRPAGGVGLSGGAAVYSTSRRSGSR